MHIYTRTGDFGYTSTLDGTKISKSHPRLELQGGIDEVNSQIGYLRSLIHNNKVSYPKLSQVDVSLKEIQYLLFKVGTTVTSNFTIPYIKAEHITTLEENIDKMVESTGKLNSFIYLSGHETASYCHVLRATTRRIERVFVHLIGFTHEEAERSPDTSTFSNEWVPVEYKFINRLADYFFQTARYLNYVTNTEEEVIT